MTETGSAPREGLGGAVGPFVVLALFGAALLTLAIFDPHEAGGYPTCPVYALTGYYCPGCGSLRGLHSVAVGDLGDAFARNPLLPVGLIALGWAWLSWTGRRSGWWRLRSLPSSAAFCGALVAVCVGFAVVRNLPIEPFTALAPTR
jgi:hypothetical protein